MRIAQINTDAALASTGTIASYLQQKLNDDGNESLLFYGRGVPGDPECSIRFSLRTEVLLHALQTRLLGIHGQGSPISTRRLLKWLEDFKPDIIHLHNLHGYYVNPYALLDYIAERGIPVIWTFHDAWPFTGHCVYYYDCEKWLTGCGNCPRKRDYPRSLLFDHSARQWQKKLAAVQRLKRLIAVSPSRWLADAAGRSFFRDKRIEIINNGIDTKDIFVPANMAEARKAFGIPEGMYVLAAVASGFGDSRKGGHYLAQLAERFAGRPVHFIAAGWQEKSGRLPENMTALPVISSPKKMSLFYNSADAFLMLSEADNFPTVCIESLACGTPIIGFTAGGVLEQVDETTGRLVPVGDMEALEAVIMECIFHKPGILSRESCRERAVTFYSKQSMYNRYLSSYREVLEMDFERS